MSNNKNTTYFIINGMRRSGLHCITDDIIRHYYIKNKTSLQLVNDTNINYFNKLQNKNNKVFLFEDQLNLIKTNMQTQYNIIIIRDIYDNLISRIKKKASWSRVDKNYFGVMKNILREILSITNNIPNKIIINYDKFISNNDYRCSILKQFTFFDIEPFSKKIPHYGGGKTFKDCESRSEVVIPRQIYHIIKNDKEFLELVKKYYNYDLIDKLDKHIQNYPGLK